MKLTMIPVFIFVINFQNETMLVKQKLAFSKNVKTCLQNKKLYLDATFKAWSFTSDFNFACKDGRVTAATCKHYSPLVVNHAQA